MQFAGKNPSRNLFLTGSNLNDNFTAAVALYVFQDSTSSAIAFDFWNFFNLQAWYAKLKSAPNAAEIKLLNDIASQSAASQPLYPSAPGWNHSQPTNATIKADIASVKSSGDPAIPTPCPLSGCVGAPSP
jgi:hypothetical protein